MKKAVKHYYFIIRFAGACSELVFQPFYFYDFFKKGKTRKELSQSRSAHLLYRMFEYVTMYCSCLFFIECEIAPIAFPEGCGLQ